ncbi:hypothetical protein Tco_1366540, partial [Tanacetum coccineum]
WRLEELRIGFTWLGGGIYDRIVEVMNLFNLTCLDLVVPRLDLIPEGFNFEKLKRFGIQIGASEDFRAGFDSYSTSERCLHIHVVDVEIALLNWTKKLIKARPAIILNSIGNINNIMPNLYQGDFNEFEYIVLDRCPNVSCLVNIAEWKQLHLGEGKINEKFFGKLKHLGLLRLDRLEALWNCSDQYITLSNLVTLDIWKCKKLVRLFSVSVAQGLDNLQKLGIGDCNSLEEVIWDGDEATNKGEIKHAEYIVFRSLSKIVFRYAQSLERFYSGYSTIKYPSLVDVKIEGCQSMRIWGPGIH